MRNNLERFDKRDVTEIERLILRETGGKPSIKRDDEEWYVSIHAPSSSSPSSKSNETPLQTASPSSELIKLIRKIFNSYEIYVRFTFIKNELIRIGDNEY